MKWKILAISILTSSASCYAQSCVSRDYGYGSTVCVCNSTYCDTIEAPTEYQITYGSAINYVTSKAGERLQPMTMKFSNTFSKTGNPYGKNSECTYKKAGNFAVNGITKCSDFINGSLGHCSTYAYELSLMDTKLNCNQATFNVSRQVYYQTMLGFGGAITDACGINTFSLSTESSEKLIRSYFSGEGIGYTFMRVPVAGTDFSTHQYEYDDDHPNDTTLEYFNLTTEDFSYKIPFIKKAQEVSPNEVKLFSAPWSAPDWMKNINTTTNASSLKEEYYQVFADYYIKFLDAYAAEGLKFWGLSPQNEPSNGLTFATFNAMGWTASQMLEYLVGNLCPTLNSNGYNNLKVMINDDQRTYVNEWVELYKNETLRECVSGMAVHWYADQFSPANILTKAHEQYPNKFLLYTEACVVRESGSAAVQLGNWTRGVRYMSDIIEVTNNWVTGWVDWNMALDLGGGPNWALNFVDSPVIVNTTADEFYKQPMFYALAHFAKFVPPGSVRIGLETEEDGGLENVAFLTPDNAIVVILQNINDTETYAVISDSDKGSLSLKISANSMNTIIYK